VFVSIILRRCLARNCDDCYSCIDTHEGIARRNLFECGYLSVDDSIRINVSSSMSMNFLCILRHGSARKKDQHTPNAV
jgi:hypothetical protein